MAPARVSTAIWRSACSLRPKPSSHQSGRPLSEPCQASHSFSTQAPLQARKHKSISAAELRRIQQARQEAYPAATKADYEDWRTRFSKKQIAAIEAGEKAISSEDLATQGRIRHDQFMPRYVEDWSRIHPTIDKTIERIRGDGNDWAEQMAQGQAWERPVLTEDNEEEALARAVLDIKHPRKASDPERDEEVKKDLTELAQRGRVNAQTEQDQHHTPAMKKLIDEYNRKVQELLESGSDEEMIEFLNNNPHPADKFGTSGDESYEDAREPSRASFVDIPGLDASPLAGPLRQNPSSLPITEPSGRMRGGTAFERLARVLGQPSISPHVAPSIPRVDDRSVRWTDPDTIASDGDSADATASASLVRTSKMLGMNIKDLKQLRSRRLVMNFVTNQTRLGKVRSIYVLTVVGNGNGMVGIGQGKSTDGPAANVQSLSNALANMTPILRYEDRTIFGEQRAKVSGVELRLVPKPPGFGLRCSSHVHEIMRCAGITDLASKITRGRNPMNVCKAVFQALTQQRHPEDIARGRGRKMVDVRKVYYAGQT